MQKYLEIGKIVTTHGIKGEVKIQPWCDSPEVLCEFDTLYNKDGSKTYSIKARPHGNMVIAKIDGIDTVEDANALRNRILYIDRDDCELPEGTYFVADLLGLDVFDEEGKFYGKLTDVTSAGGANDVYELNNNGKLYYIPAIPSVILKTDIEAKKMVIYPMEGLFDED